MKYPIAIEPGDESRAWSVVVPDLPGCFSAADSGIDEAIENAKEAIETAGTIQISVAADQQHGQQHHRLEQGQAHRVPELAAARAQIEALTRCALITQSWRIVLDAWPDDGRVRLRIGNLSMHHHPIHIHGHRFSVTGSDGGRWPRSAWLPEVTTLVAVGQQRSGPRTRHHLAGLDDGDTFERSGHVGTVLRRGPAPGCAVHFLPAARLGITSPP